MAIAQGTVKSFDERARTGSIFLDDGAELPFSAQAFQAGGLRLLRLGQRVRFDTGPDGAIIRITLLTLPERPALATPCPCRPTVTSGPRPAPGRATERC